MSEMLTQTRRRVHKDIFSLNYCHVRIEAKRKAVGALETPTATESATAKVR